MSTESDPNQNQNVTPAVPPAPAPGTEAPKSQDAAAKALGEAKEKMAAGVEAFKKLDLQAQIYLGGLALTVLCSILFSAVGVSVKADGPMADVIKQSASSASVPVIRAGANGLFAVLAAAAGIGLWVWNFMGKKKETWAPLAIAGSAGLSALLYVLLWLRSGTKSVSMGSVEISMHMTIFGFWLPLAAAIAAAYVSIKPLVKPQQAPSAPPAA